MDKFLQDVKYGIRMLARSPGFTSVALLTLALGIGATTAIFSVVHAVLLAPLPYEDDAKLVRAVRAQPHVLGTIASYPDYTDWRDSGVFSGAGAISGRNFFYETGEGHQMLRGARISADFLPTLGVRMAMGRNFLPDEATGDVKVAILAYPFWNARLNRDPDVLSRDLKLSGQIYRVVGVLPAEYRDPISPISGRDVYVPMVVPAGEAVARNSQWLHLIARLKPGVGLAQARRVVEALSERALAEPKDIRDLPKFTAVPLRELQLGDTSRVLWLLLGAVAFVLLIACANVSNLLLARANARSHELAVRAAVGAGRGRLLSQVLTESLVLSLIGGAIALVLLLWGLEAIKAVSPLDIPRLDHVGLNVTVFAFAVFCSFACGLLFGALPAMRCARQDVASIMNASRTLGSVQNRRALAALLVGEVALTIVLLTGAGLALQSLIRLISVETGFAKGHVLVVPTTFAGEWDAARQTAFYQNLVERVRALPGVTAAGVVDNMPLSGSWSQYTTNYQSFLQKYPPEKAERQIEYQACVIGGEYLAAMGIPLRAGRGFSAAQPGETPREAIVSENFVQALWGDADPLGQRVNIGGREPLWVEIVGVVGNVRHRGLEVQSAATLYTPFGRRQQWDGTLVVRGEQSLTPLTATIRQMAREMESGVVIRSVRTLDDLFRTHTASSRFLAFLLGSFAGLATLLAMVGTYGVLAYAVGQQTREIGIRMALGAQPRVVLRSVVQKGMTLVGMGVGIGLLAAAGLSRYLRALLFEVSPSDPLAYILVAVVLLLVALGACWLPARRASRVDPMVALRYE